MDFINNTNNWVKGEIFEGTDITFFLFTKNATTQSIAIVFLMLGVSLLVIDYFSEERATIYYAEIVKVLK